MKALVTGGGGFLGSRIVQMLHTRGDDVTVFGRQAYPHHDRLGIKTLRGDLRDAQAVRRACEGMDIVFQIKVRLYNPQNVIINDMNCFEKNNY